MPELGQTSEKIWRQSRHHWSQRRAAEFLPIVEHMHLKDYSGGKDWVGYCPLGQGKVDTPAVLDMMDSKQMAGTVMMELDSSPDMPLAPQKSAAVAKAYLEKQCAKAPPASRATIRVKPIAGNREVLSWVWHKSQIQS